ncbi:lytic murein transglycosylase [Halomonas sp. 18H]|uniref:lytic murein transglycosylase n=1 Tax=Halomonas almeriensis TaxID=308163 RepID=UPI002230274B|nr:MULTISPECIES: lytic murein transglycosylase [Halomonas]MCW4149453.1 lytic murein transglycosylase [Halomonas sp. 18H]MDN3553601.1 lytic murein transglycosylase [Halomonas almeriensis]
MTFKFLPLALLCIALVGCQSAQPRDARAESPTREASASSTSSVADTPATAREMTFAAWLADFRRQARAEGISAATLQNALDGVRYRPRVIELDGSQPEFVRPIWEYLDSAVSATRIDNGRERLARYRDTAEQMAARYGVPSEVLVAIWGIESSYGDYLGDFSTLEALATLAYDGRRSDFARGELMAALRIIQAGDIPPARMKGSWAGAMGHTQFIPSSFLAHAVDGDGDGRRDIWGSIPDVMASTANYLDEAGWRQGQPWGTEVRLASGFDYSLTEPDTRRSTAEWQAAGVLAPSGDSLPSFDSAAVITPAGAQGPAFLVGHNFRVILRYNNATSYALAVAKLSDAIAGRSGIQGDWPREQPPLKRSDVRDMQRLLNERGYNAGTPDGILGPNTRRGLRAFQRDIGVTPDGFATQALLDRLRS